jgi:2-polyprenyl-3-methyl-5-hydroxy-6-metoxy-1,4-benzoquinol methylase
MRLRLRDKSGPPVLGHNLHCLRGHQRLAFVQENYHPGTALDVGSGQGAFAIWLHRKGCDVTMLDILPIVPTPDLGIRTLQMDLYDLKSHEERYDTVLFMEVIEHVQEPFRAVALCYRVTAPGGVVLITTPWVDTWDREADHVWRFDQDGLVELLAIYEGFVWADETFVYAVLEKPE